MSDESLIEELKAIAHPLRYQVLQLLRKGERNVGEIEQESGIGQPTLSQQLSVLRKAGLVETRKKAKLVFYSLNEDRLAELGAIIGGFDPSSMMRATAARKASPGAANFARLTQ